MKIQPSDQYWSLATVLLSVLFSGLINEFRFLDEITFQVHDTYFVISLWQITLLFFIFISFFLFFILSFKSKFQNLSRVWVLLVCNTLLLAVIAYSIYITCSLINIGNEPELMTADFKLIVAQRIRKAAVFFLPITTLLIASNFLLGRRIVQLNKRSL